MKNKDVYKYATVLLLGVVVVLIAALSYSEGRNSVRYTTISASLQSSAQTSQSTLPPSAQCSNQYAAVSVGNAMSCGPFLAKVAYLNATNATLQIYYNGKYVNQSVFGVSSQKSYNFGSGGTYGIYIAGTIPSNSSAYFIIDNGYVVCTTVPIPQPK